MCLQEESAERPYLWDKLLLCYTEFKSLCCSSVTVQGPGHMKVPENVPSQFVLRHEN